MAKSRIYNKNCIAPCFDNSLLHAPLFSQKQMRNIKRFFVGAFAVLILLAFITPVIAYAGIAGKNKETLFDDMKIYVIDKETYATAGNKVDFNWYENYEIKEKYHIEYEIAVKKEGKAYKVGEEIQINNQIPDALIRITSFTKSIFVTPLFGEGKWETSNCFDDKGIHKDFGIQKNQWYDYEEIYNLIPKQYGRMYANMRYGLDKAIYAIDFMSELLMIQNEKDVVGGKGGFFVNAAFWQTIRIIYNTLLSIGVLLMVVYLVLYMIQTASETGGFTPEKWLSLGIKFVLVVMVMSWGFEIIQFIIQLGNSIIGSLKINVNSGPCAARVIQFENALTHVVKNPNTGIFADAVNDFWGLVQGLCDGISAAFNFAWTVLGMLLVEVVGAITLLSRALKFAVYVSAAPIALADSWNGVNSHSIKYLKQIFSFFLQGVVIVAALILFSAISGSNMIDYGNVFGAVGATTADIAISPLRTLMLGIACCSIMLSSKKISDSIIGA